MRRLAWVALVAITLTVAMSGAASGQPGDLFELRAGGDNDWAPTSGALLTSSGSKVTGSGVLASPFGSAAYEEEAGPGVARARFAGTFTNPPLETRRLNPSAFARATTRLTVIGPDGVVNVRFKAHVDATVVHTCGLDFICNSDVTVFVGDQNTVVVGPGGGASPNLLGLSVDPVPGGYRVHGDYVSSPRPVTANAPFDAQLSLQLHVANLGRGVADSSSFDARGEVSFPTTGTVLDVPAGYTVSGENVEDNRWTDPFAPPPAPDIELRFGNGTPIGSGDVLDLGTIASGATSPASTFGIANTGAADLHVQPLSAPSAFAVADQPDATVAPGESTTADLTCSATNPGSTPLVLDEVVTVASDDPDEGSLPLNVRCTVQPGTPSSPEIELQSADGSAMPQPALIDLGTLASGSIATVGYRIANVGTAPLAITSVTTDAPPGRGSASQPAAGAVAPGAHTTADVSCGGFNDGDAQVSVVFRARINSNDPDESPADVLVRCQVLPATEPDIALFFTDGTPMGNNAILDLGDVPSGETELRSYRIGNAGDAQLTITSITATRPDFGIGEAFDPDDSAIDPGESARAQVGCGGTNTSATATTVEFEIHVSSNDPDESPAVFRVRCSLQPAPPGEPELRLLFPDGGQIPFVPGNPPAQLSHYLLDLGAIPNGSFVSGGFRIANVGTAELSGISSAGDPYDLGGNHSVEPRQFNLAPGASEVVPVVCGGSLLYSFVSVAISSNVGFALLRVACDRLRPELRLRRDDNSGVLSLEGLDLGDVASGGTATGHYRIANVGTAELTIGSIDATQPTFGTAGASGPDDDTVEPGANTRASVSCGGTNTGNAPRNVHFEVQVTTNALGVNHFPVSCRILPEDTTFPTVAGTPDRAPNAAGWYKAPVTIDWLATDNSGSAGDPPDTVAATEGANVLYKSGSSCDAAGNCANGSLWLSIDLTAPSITAPALMAADATSPNGANVSYTATAGDALDGAPQLSCLPASGSRFAIGTTTVTCTASDKAGNTSTRAFGVEVRGAAAQVVMLAQKTLAFLDLPSLAPSLATQLQAAAAAVVANNRRVACTALNVYIAVVRAAPPRAFTAAEKNSLVADANRIKAVVDC